jgi:hypothetical protein
MRKPQGAISDAKRSALRQEKRHSALHPHFRGGMLTAPYQAGGTPPYEKSANRPENLNPLLSFPLHY